MSSFCFQIGGQSDASPVSKTSPSVSGKASVGESVTSQELVTYKDYPSLKRKLDYQHFVKLLAVANRNVFRQFSKDEMLKAVEYANVFGNFGHIMPGIVVMNNKIFLTKLCASTLSLSYLTHAMTPIDREELLESSEHKYIISNYYLDLAKPHWKVYALCLSPLADMGTIYFKINGDQ